MQQTEDVQKIVYTKVEFRLNPEPTPLSLKPQHSQTARSTAQPQEHPEVLHMDQKCNEIWLVSFFYNSCGMLSLMGHVVLPCVEERPHGKAYPLQGCACCVRAGQADSVHVANLAHPSNMIPALLIHWEVSRRAGEGPLVFSMGVTGQRRWGMGKGPSKKEHT